MERSPWHPLTPLNATREDDRRQLAITRSDELAIVTNMVAASRVSLLYAMSGNGKTSLINAGLVPFFTEQGYAVFTVRPRPPHARNDPRAAFRHCVLDQLPNAIHSSFDHRALEELSALVARSERTDLAPFTERLTAFVDLLPQRDSLKQTIRQSFEQQPNQSIPELLRGVSEMVGRDRPILVVIDQFEELFVHFSNKESLSDYVDDLGAVWADAMLNVRLLFSMREDWVGSMIVLRRAIPEVFKDSYRLMPLTESKAASVLIDALPAGQTFEPAAVTRIINDVAGYYGRIEKRRLGRVEVDRMKSKERLVDLPALQIVADRLWQTRHETATPFSLAHYERLAPGRPSPAGEVLDRYLSDLLAPPAQQEICRLQIDALYALTDGVAHRRASVLPVMTREIADSKSRDGEPTADETKIKVALAPLADVAVVRTTETAEGIEYELAHDFLVRAVVSLRQQLDLDRATERGKAEVARKRKEERLQILEKRNDIRTMILQITPVIAAVGLIGFLWSTLALASGDTDAVRFSIASPGPGILVYIAFVALLVAAAFSHHRTLTIVAVVGLIVPTIVWIGLAQEQRFVSTLNAQLFSKTTQFQQVIRKTRSSESRETADKLVEKLQQVTDTLESDTSPASSLNLIGSLNLDEYPFYWVEPYLKEVAPIRNSLVRIAGFGFNAHTVGSILLGVTFLALFLVSLRSTASLQSSPRWTERVLLWWGELVDTLIVVVPTAAAMSIASRINQDSALVTGGVVLAVILAIQVVVAVRVESSIGFIGAGFRISSSNPAQLLVRQVIAVMWAVLCVIFVMLPWLIISSIGIYVTRASVPDLLTGCRPKRIDEETGEAMPSTAPRPSTLPSST